MIMPAAAAVAAVSLAVPARWIAVVAVAASAAGQAAGAAVAVASARRRRATPTLMTIFRSKAAVLVSDLSDDAVRALCAWAAVESPTQHAPGVNAMMDLVMADIAAGTGGPTWPLSASPGAMVWATW